MAENSKIQWTHHTFNPWRGCARVSPGCFHCYAETLSKRNPKTLGTWGVDGTRVVASEAYWKQPLRWNKEAARLGERHRVFCASLADVGEDRPDLVAPRARLCDLILATDSLDWLLLTKRIKNIARLFPEDVLKRVWLGTTTEDQPRYDARIGRLLRTTAKLHFLSIEPLLSDIDMRMGGMSMPDYADLNPLPQLGWLIVGGESGGQRRDPGLDAIVGVARQGIAAGVPVFVKQDVAFHPGQQGRIPDDIWALKQFPSVPMSDQSQPSAKVLKIAGSR
jgi:protein gp37